MFDKLKKAVEELEHSEKFKEFKKENPEAYLASCVIILTGNNLSEWQVDYYLPKKHKLATFIIREQADLKGEDEIFQKEKTEIKDLRLKDVKVDLDKAMKILEKLRKKKYSGEFTNKTIVILQVLEGKIVWNMTLITSTLKVINVKINAKTGRIISEKLENLLSFRAS